MKTNKDILENGYWSGSSSSSIRSEFDEEYYKKKPPPPNFEDYLEKIVVIKEGQFPQSEAQLQNLNLSYESKIQSNVQQKSGYKNLAVSSSKSETNVNGRKAPDRQRCVPQTNITNGNDVQHKLSRSHSNTRSKINTTEQNQSLTTNENFRRGPNYVGPFTNRNANGNDTKPQQYSTPQSSKSNGVEEILSKRINQKPTTLYSINSSNTAEGAWGERIESLPSPSNSSRSIKIENKQLYNVPLLQHSTSRVTTSSVTAVQPTASRNNPLQNRQTAISIPVTSNEETTTESATEKCYRVCCFWFNCCV